MTTSRATTVPTPQSQVGKLATDPSRFIRPIIPFINARTAFKAFMLGLDFSSHDEVLLPSYIGWSHREGSGVFDPIQDVAVKFRFYRVTSRLTIDIDDLRAKLAIGRPRLLVLIHYFGYPDPNIVEASSLARERGLLILEDEAHALYSDWVGGICGRFGDAAIFSLHKMLPFGSGGLLVINNARQDEVIGKLIQSDLRKSPRNNLLDYDLVGISRKRRSNAKALLEMLQPLNEKVRPLHAVLPDGVVPQTLPVIVRGASRDKLYFRMNEHGYGVISLYHTLIDTITESEFPDSHWLSRRILNLPVHQDASLDALSAMIRYLESLL